MIASDFKTSTEDTPLPLKISVVISTYRRLPLLKACIESLEKAAQSCGQHKGIDLEMIVAVNGSDPETYSWLKRHLGEHPTFKSILKVFEQKRTPSAVRNDLIGFATGEWVYFVDDDAAPTEDLFKHFQGRQEEYTPFSAVGGPNLTPPHSNFTQRVTGEALASAFATAISTARYREGGDFRECGEESLILCNLFVRKSVLGEAPFPLRFLCGEENWLLQNLAERNLKMAYDPKLVVFHVRRPTLFGFMHQILRYGIGRGQLTRGKPSGARGLHFLPSLFVLYVLSLPALCILSAQIQAQALIPLTVYLILSLGAGVIVSVQNRSLSSFIVVTLFPIIHIVYGIGFVLGLFRH